MWDVCICDLGYKKEKIICSPGHFGIKPLYFAQMNQTPSVWFRLNLLEHPKFDRKIFNEDALGNYLRFNLCRLMTFLKGGSACSRDIIYL